MNKTEELFDVVDDRDEVIDCKPRRVVHQLGLKHRAVHVLIFNSKGELFLQKRSMLKDCFPGRWDSSSSGHLNVGEAYDDCAMREVHEELGFPLAEPPQRILHITPCGETGQEFVWVYKGFAEGPFVLEEEEIETGGWFSTRAVDEWIKSNPAEFAPALILIWELLKKNGGLPQIG
ncbi:MAG: NUDIX hydrolase [Verrucomicrobiales bacterium]